MSSRLRLALAAVLVVSLPLAVAACLWDYDTLQQERSRFPDALELITGKFLRHSREFYEWRIQDRLKKLEAAPNEVALYDDLAVAYQKTGRHEKAVETILAKEKIKPGLYETYSNLGTFYVLAGDFEKGLPYIDQALAINPDAHFGREKYQKWLVEYAMTRVESGQLRLPLWRDTQYDEHGKRDPSNFHEFLAGRLKQPSLSVEEARKAVTGILGMMRFANHDNPLLLEALGDLLSHPHESPEDAKRLAARAYLQASYGANDKDTQQAYRELAKNVLRMQTRDASTHDVITLGEVESEFKKQLADADAWYAALQAKELAWIREGKNVEVEFDQLYSETPVAAGEASDEVMSPVERGIAIGVPIVVGGAVAVGLFLVWRRRAAS